jgi:excisionase family DNA binding protein
MEVVTIGKSLSKDKAAEILGVSRATIDRLRKKGLPSYKIGGLIKFDEDEVKEWFKKQK